MLHFSDREQSSSSNMKGRTLKLTRRNTTSLTDQNGHNYLKAKRIYDADSSTLFDFQCDKYESQKCMARLRYNEITMEGILIASHSCRWSYEELPDYRKEHIFIKTGYHPTISTWSEKLKLLFTLHSETINIWSHMFGIFLFCGYLLDSSLNGDAKYYWARILFDLGAMMLFTNSTAYHWLHICSESSHKKYTCLDYSGIAIYGYAKHITWVYHGLFYGNLLFSALTYIHGICLFLALFFSYKSVYQCVYGSVDWEFNERIRNGIFVGCSLGLHLSILYQYHVGGISMECWLVNLIAYVAFGIGFTIYAIKYPEVVWPGRFDLYFNSHQIMHFMVLIATVLDRSFFDCLHVSK